MNHYFSFLLCSHPATSREPSTANLYYNGTPIGILRGGTFELHRFTMPDGIKRTLTINDLPEPCQFDSLDDLIAGIQSILGSVSFPKPIVP